MVPPGPTREWVPANREVARQIDKILKGPQQIRSAFRAMTHVLCISPEHSETEDLPGEHRVFARKPEANPGIPGLAILYRYDAEEIVIWDLRVEWPGK